MHFSQFSYSGYCSRVLPSQDCWPVLRLYPAVHMQALVVGEVGKHSCEQSPLLLLHRLTPAKEKKEIRGTFSLLVFALNAGDFTSIQNMQLFFCYLSAHPHHRSSCASLGRCCFAKLSSFLHPSCHMFPSGQFPDRPTTACLLHNRCNQNISKQKNDKYTEDKDDKLKALHFSSYP